MSTKLAQAVRQLRPDGYVLALLATVAVASVLPCRGPAADAFKALTTGAIVLLFFLHGVRLPREAIVTGLAHWRLHLLILASTYALFPAVGLALSRLAPAVLPAPLWLGVLFVCMLPSTVQSSIAFTSIARGNVPAALCAAAASNLIGIALTPALVGAFMSFRGAVVPVSQVWTIVLELLVPFVGGHLLRPWLSGWAARNRRLVTLSDRGSILLAVYTSFSAAVVQGIWRELSPPVLLTLVVVDAALLALVLLATTCAGRLFGFGREDEIAIVFCGSKKSLASGVPMASVLFAGPTVGMTVLPLMIFHQMQLMVCASLARRYAAQAPEAALAGS
ncbi:MAG TPA: bile acid:sodium symporter family protein [Polyangiaceae bacterium]|nr:bile acid:sodium symporter family protein [Polyangiaceae bacterium]